MSSQNSFYKWGFATNALDLSEDANSLMEGAAW